MDDRLYIKNVTCPICDAVLQITKLRSKAVKVKSRDSDFCVYYESINPLWYEVWVCKHCGCAAMSDKFESISEDEIYKIRMKIAAKWHGKGFDGERSIDTAIETFKLALLNAQIRNASKSEIARICLRIAWLYREKGNESEKENDFLRFTLNGYMETYEQGRFPVDKLDEVNCLYIVAEISLRLKNYDDAIVWFGKLISSPEAKKNEQVLEMARNQYQITKQQLSSKKT